MYVIAHKRTGKITVTGTRERCEKVWEMMTSRMREDFILRSA